MNNKKNGNVIKFLYNLIEYSNSHRLFGRLPQYATISTLIGIINWWLLYIYLLLVCMKLIKGYIISNYLKSICVT